MIGNIGTVRGGGLRERSPPAKWKKCQWKKVVFPTALFLATKFRKIVKIQFFI